MQTFFRTKNNRNYNDLFEIKTEDGVNYKFVLLNKNVDNSLIFCRIQDYISIEEYSENSLKEFFKYGPKNVVLNEPTQNNYITEEQLENIYNIIKINAFEHFNKLSETSKSFLYQILSNEQFNFLTQNGNNHIIPIPLNNSQLQAIGDYENSKIIEPNEYPIKAGYIEFLLANKTKNNLTKAEVELGKQLLTEKMNKKIIENLESEKIMFYSFINLKENMLNKEQKRFVKLMHYRIWSDIHDKIPKNEKEQTELLNSKRLIADKSYEDLIYIEILEAKIALKKKEQIENKKQSLEKEFKNNNSNKLEDNEKKLIENYQKNIQKIEELNSEFFIKDYFKFNNLKSRFSETEQKSQSVSLMFIYFRKEDELLNKNVIYVIDRNAVSDYFINNKDLKGMPLYGKVELKESNQVTVQLCNTLFEAGTEYMNVRGILMNWLTLALKTSTTFSDLQLTEHTLKLIQSAETIYTKNLHKLQKEKSETQKRAKEIRFAITEWKEKEEKKMSAQKTNNPARP